MQRTLIRILPLVYLLALFFAVLLSGCASSQQAAGQNVPQSDRKAERYFNDAMDEYHNGNYRGAAQLFESAAQRPFNRVTTASIYMAGNAYYNARRSQQALTKFMHLIRKYPQSIYTPEAKYHKGLILLDRPEKKSGGLYVLMNLYESTEDEGLKTAIDQAIQDFLYNEAELDFVENYYSIVRPSFKPMVLNALAYRLHEAGQEENLRAIIQEYDQENDSVPDKVRRFYDPDNPPRKVLDEELRIALMLPFHAYSYVDGLTSKARQAINFYAGVKQALDTLRFPGVRGVKLRTFDTQQDSVLAAKLMNDEVATFQPDIIIGGFYNGPSMAIAKYSDEHNIPQIIPFSNAPRLVRNTEQVLLANSLIKTRGKKLAEVIATQAMVNRLLIVSDQSTTSRTLAETVADYLDKTGTATARIDLAAQRKPAEVVQRLKAAPKSAGGRFDGLFLPLLSEHKANLILQQLRQADLRLALFGVKDFQYFQAVDPAVLYRYKMIFPTNYYPRNDSIHEPRFTANYKFAYGDRPSREARQGYDIIRWLLHAYGLNSDQGTIRKALVQARQFQGLNQDYHLEPGHRDNQAVQILQFWNNEIREYQGWRQSNTER